MGQQIKCGDSLELKNFGLLFLMIFGFIVGHTTSELTPPYFNLATGRKIYATATCGVDTDGPELYCKLVGANTENAEYEVIQGQFCDTCDSTTKEKNHPPENAIDGKETWWQSPPLSRGMKYNEVNLTIDFEQEFHVAYIFIRMGNSPRPGLWSLEKSADYGKTWTPWQHFSDTHADCEKYFGAASLRPITRDDNVICTTEYSKIVPLEDGEIPITLLNNRPSAKSYFNSTTLQEWTRATNIRIVLLRTKNLLGHLMSVARQDPTVTRRYFYSIKDISIGGRCMCNGFASTCDVPKGASANQPRVLACHCQHNTCGIQCSECCSGFEQKKWRQNTNARPFRCEPCNCFGHATHCIYDEEVDRKALSLDIHGIYDGGGVCQNCQHNTEGINCNKCKSRFYRPSGKYWNETDVCQPCDCNQRFSTGNCEEETGRCECRKEFQKPNCDACAYGYFDYPNCRECECYLNGTAGYHCEVGDGVCPCKYNFAGSRCNQCADGYYNFPECESCECSSSGSMNNDCDFVTGHCKCLSNYGGDKCERCKHGYYDYSNNCLYCNCDEIGTEEEICNKTSGRCLCKPGFGGPRCDQCLPGFYNYPNCVPCNCSIVGSISKACDPSGRCECLPNFGGRQCSSCSIGYYSFPSCIGCNCDIHGSDGISCNDDGQCFCKHNFDGKNCEQCKLSFYNFPACEECNCDPAGVTAKFAGCESVPPGELCQCKERVTGRICDQCKSLYWNLNISNPDGCEDCDCYIDGTIGGLDTCESKSGQCACKPSVTGRTCRECKDGTFDLFGSNLFGCKDCGCDIGGARKMTCEKRTGGCDCHPRITGRRCTDPLTTHYFPTLYQFLFEYEDGVVPSGQFVRYQFDENIFPGFSGKGYATFSPIQNEVIYYVNIYKSSVYRMVIRYLNPTTENVTASILITSDNPSEVDQITKVLFKPTKIPQFVTVSGARGDKPSPIVLDPGRYSISTKTTKPIALDYFVLLPAAYYEASILTKKVTTPCEIGSTDLCRHNKYPLLDEFKPVTIPYVIIDGKNFKPNETYMNHEHLSLIDEQQFLPILSEDQINLYFKVDVPHTGYYVILIDYITVPENRNTQFLKVIIFDNDDDAGYGMLVPCLYSTVCRQPITDNDREKHFLFNTTENIPVRVILETEEFGQVAIKSITAIPADHWSVDFISPSSVCVMEHGKCVGSGFPSIPGAKKIEFEFDHEERIADIKPQYIFNSDAKLIYLYDGDASIEIKSKVTTPSQYVIVVKYYQPNHPTYQVFFRLITEKQNYDGKLIVQHCPSNAGCRVVIRPDSSFSGFDIENDFKLILTNNKPYGVWLDYILVTPIDQFKDDLLREDPFDQTKKFIQECGQDHFYIDLNTTEFCKKAVFSLTANYNDGALPCSCNTDGSNSFECDPFGGQCQCKPNVIGRQCEACRTGFYGFPECKYCNCPATSLCEKDTGECICPTNVIGEQCDQCKPYTYNFHQIHGCDPCDCNQLGTRGGNLQCDLLNGTCDCRPNIENRACDMCSHGFYDFPHCMPCQCSKAGTIFEICDKDDETCLCKKNVIGRECNQCMEGTYNLQASNPEGCTSCFCFGKTNRCQSAHLRVFNVSMLENVTISTLLFKDDYFEFEDWRLSRNEIFLNDTTAEADFSLKPNEGLPPNSDDQELVYFKVLEFLLDQKSHLTAYGGYLGYNLFYTTGLFGKSVIANDIILFSKHNVLVHQSYKQPAPNKPFHNKIQMIETNFNMLNGKPVTRADFMMVLRDLDGIYIRASYDEQNIVTLISDVYLTLANEDNENYHLYQELAVEKCQCPPGYVGLSCEECAPGYYRDANGPYGGYCVPCECHGHAATCDCNNGICQNCTHFTTGDHCEKCIEGYHGIATFGRPNDCMICACPLPYDSNNFATMCEISESGDEITCDCKPGYTGAQCESCAAGYYGEPRKLGDYCKPCDCSGNINPSEPDACDSVTGECTQCLNNTFGWACNLCAPGYYGDAVKMKDCKSCDCESLGTLHCDSFQGICHCHKNVIGERCDRCKEDHYRYDSGLGCESCDCSIASYNTQCDDHTGACKCKPGVTGRRCERCAVDHWNYTVDGCVPCSCNKGYSIGFGCNAETGQCECLPGVVGEKCDACPWRWALIKNQGCIECDICHHALLNVTDMLQNDLAPVLKDFDTIAIGYFTAQKLNYYNDSAEKIAPLVHALDPKGVNLTPVEHVIETLEQDCKNAGKQISYNEKTAKEYAQRSEKLKKDAAEMIKQSEIDFDNVNDRISEVKMLAESFDKSATTVIDSALNEANDILNQLNNITIDLLPITTQNERSMSLLFETDNTMSPVKIQKDKFDALHQNLGIFNEKLKDLNNWRVNATKIDNDVREWNEKNRLALTNSKFDTVANQTSDAIKNIKEANDLIINGELTLNAINRSLSNLNETVLAMKDANRDVDDKLPKASDKHDNIKPEVAKAIAHSQRLVDLAKTVTNQYSKIKPNWDEAIDAATSYTNIADSVAEARDNVTSAQKSLNNVTILIDNFIINRASEANKNASELLANARKSLSKIQIELEPHLNRSTNAVEQLWQLHEKCENELSNINQNIDQLEITKESSVWQESHENALDAHDDAKKALEILKPITKSIPEDLDIAKKVANDYDTANKEYNQARNQLNAFSDIVPSLNEQIDNITNMQNEANDLIDDLADHIKRLRTQIESARAIANSIEVGVSFKDGSVLELKAPETLRFLAAKTDIEMYAKAEKEDGMLFFLGNEYKNVSATDQTKHNDYFSIILQNGYPILKIDVGNGPEELNSEKNILNNNWHRLAVERTGNNVKFIVDEELPDKSVKSHVKEASLEGQYSIFNANEDTKIFVGGFPSDFIAPEGLNYMASAKGKVQNLKIGNEHVGLWNFVDAEGIVGARDRDQLLTDEIPKTGCRFNGNGYVTLDARNHHFRVRSNVNFKFKASKDSKDGLLFYAGKNRQFIAVEMRDGNIHFQFKLGEHHVDISSNEYLNDDKWHAIEISRDKRVGVLKIDGRLIRQEETVTGPDENLKISDELYFGGYPGKLQHSELRGNYFDGCIDNVTISGTQINLNRNLKGIDVRPGCPEKFSFSLSFASDDVGYLKSSNISAQNGFEVSLKFRTKKPDGIIFYATNPAKSSAISLVIQNGALILNNKNPQLKTDGHHYNDGEWHAVTVTQNYAENQLRLSADDQDIKRIAEYNRLNIEYGDMYFGGLPSNYMPIEDVLTTWEHFVGCINDAILNGNIVNFVKATDKKSANIHGCPLEVPEYEEPPLIGEGDVFAGVDAGVSVPGPFEDRFDTVTTDAPIVHQPHVVTVAPSPYTTRAPPPITTHKPLIVHSEQRLQEYPSRPTKPPPMKQVPIKAQQECALPFGPDFDIGYEAGYMFGTLNSSRLEYFHLNINKEKLRTGYDFQLEFRTENADGLLFYATDDENIDFISLYLKEGKLHYTVQVPTVDARIKSGATYNDGDWHKVLFSRSQAIIHMKVDDVQIQSRELPIAARPLNMALPLCLGGVCDNVVFSSELMIEPYFKGCIRNFKMNDDYLPVPKPIGLIPCSSQLESGIYFGDKGGYIKVHERFNVGQEMDIVFDIRPRVTSGLLLSNHGKSAYLIIELVNDTLYFRVNNGLGEFVAIYTLGEGESFCDGKWRQIQAIKSNYVATLIVNGIASQPAIGPAGEFVTKTGRPLFLGGHQRIKNAPGITARVPFHGCIRNLKVLEIEVLVENKMAKGDVLVGVCLTN